MKTERNKLDDPRVREALVLAAEAVAPALASAEKRKGQRVLDKTQLSRLVTISGQASCGAEITNYLRYQVARGVWPMQETQDTIKKVEAVLESQDIEVGDEVRAWKLFASYLSRAFRYQTAIGENK